MTATSELDASSRNAANPFLRPIVILGVWLGLPARRSTVRMRDLLWPIKPLNLWCALAAAALVIATMFLVDAWAITAATRLPPELIGALDFLTDFGKSNWFLVPLGGLLVVLALVASAAPSRLSYLVLTGMGQRLWFLFLAVALPGLFTDVLKVIGRARPFVTGVANPFVFSFFNLQYDYESMPSGHATTAFAAVIAFGALWPRVRPVMWVYALTIAVSRVALRAHHPSDVMAGAIVGMLSVVFIRHWFAARRLVFLIDPAGKERALPGPSLRRIWMIARGLVRSRHAPLAVP